MGSDGSGNTGAARKNCLYCSRCCAVLFSPLLSSLSLSPLSLLSLSLSHKDYSELRKFLVQTEERGQKGLLSIEDSDIAARWTFTMQVKDHVLPLHLGKDGKERCIINDARR